MHSYTCVNIVNLEEKQASVHVFVCIPDVSGAAGKRWGDVGGWGIGGGGWQRGIWLLVQKERERGRGGGGGYSEDKSLESRLLKMQGDKRVKKPVIALKIRLQSITLDFTRPASNKRAVIYELSVKE